MQFQPKPLHLTWMIWSDSDQEIYIQKKKDYSDFKQHFYVSLKQGKGDLAVFRSYL